MNTRALPLALLFAVVSAPTSAQLLFGPKVATLEPPSTEFDRRAIGDVNGDGFADLVLGHAGVPTLCLGDGLGHFGAATPIDIGATGSAVSLADLNGDEVLDLLVGTSLEAVFHVAMGAGDGSFGVPSSYSLGATSFDTNRLSLNPADADGDGDVDVLALTGGHTGDTLGEARLFRNLGTGVLGMVGVVNGNAFGAVKIDGGFPVNLNGDDRPDMVVAFSAGLAFPDRSASALICQPNGSFVASWTTTTMTPLHGADLDGDGDQDLLCMQLFALFGSNSNIVSMLNAGDGSLSGGPVTVVAPTLGSLGQPQDLDADGTLDLVFNPSFPAELWLMRGTGRGSFGPPDARVSLSQVVGAGGVQLADIDGDGRLDVTCIGGLGSPGAFQAVSFNRTYESDGPLLDLGQQLEGGSWPIQLVEGSFQPGQPFSFSLSGVPASGFAWHVVGFAQLDAPFKGGTMVPQPFLITGPWAATPSGNIHLASVWPGGPSGTELAFQFWMPDPSGPAGFASSSGVQLTVP